MDVVIAGGHGKIALALERMLAAAGHRARGLIRNPDHAGDLEAVGAVAIVADLETDVDLAALIAGADAVVFAAGAGPGSGPARKQTVDRGGALKLIDAAHVAGVRRYVMVSSVGADDPSSGPEQMRPYLEAKAQADAALVASGLDFTIVRPHALTDDLGTGRITVAERLPERGRIPREDVAATLLACLLTETTIGRTFEVASADTPITQALARL